jgi:hypothetical protein
LIGAALQNLESLNCVEKAPTRNGLVKVVVIVQAGVNAKDESEEKEESHDSLGVSVIHWTREPLMLTAHEAKNFCQTIDNEVDKSQKLPFQSIRTLLHEVMRLQGSRQDPITYLKGLLWYFSSRRSKDPKCQGEIKARADRRSSTWEKAPFVQELLYSLFHAGPWLQDHLDALFPKGLGWEAGTVEEINDRQSVGVDWCLAYSFKISFSQTDWCNQKQTCRIICPSLKVGRRMLTIVTETSGRR